MPRYFFQLIDQGELYYDTEGQELPDDEAARHEASLALTEVARDVLLKDGLFHEFEVIVKDHRGQTVWRTRLDFEAERGDATASRVTDA